jgi:hypothetical protein
MNTVTQGRGPFLNLVQGNHALADAPLLSWLTRTGRERSRSAKRSTRARLDPQRGYRGLSLAIGVQEVLSQISGVVGHRKGDKGCLTLA